jgi:hypothetical protein
MQHRHRAILVLSGKYIYITSSITLNSLSLSVYLYLFSDVRLSANACRVQVNNMCKRMHDQVNETNARLMKDITNSEQV